MYMYKLYKLKNTSFLINYVFWLSEYFVINKTLIENIKTYTTFHERIITFHAS